MSNDDLIGLLPYLSEGFCNRCRHLLETRLQNLNLSAEGKSNGISLTNGHNAENSANFCSADSSSLCSLEKSSTSSINGSIESSPWSSGHTQSRRQGDNINLSPASVSSRQSSLDRPGYKVSLDDELDEVSLVVSDPQIAQKGPILTREQREQIRFSQVGRKKDYVHIERVNGKPINVLQGLELHTRVFSAAEQKRIVDHVYGLQRMGRAGKLRERTYSEPRKWMRGKGRVTIQFGCCYNYAVDKNGNPPGIIRDEEVDPIPSLLKSMIRRLVGWHVLPPTCVPNSCIVNIYDEGDCIPPHIDHHDFVRPFCTVSFLTECNILFGSNLKIAGPGEFSGPVAIPLPIGSVLVLKGNGADVAKHCVPAVPGKRISITFRKMDDSKLPYKFLPDPDFQGLRPLVYSPSTKTPVQQVQHPQHIHHVDQLSGNESEVVGETSGSPFHLGKDDFPPLGGSGSVNRPRKR